jgi:putative restriction endonuclease
MTITPDYSVHVREDVLVETDGPMLIHGLQGFHGAQIGLPRQGRHWPDRQLLEERYARFKLAR